MNAAEFVFLSLSTLMGGVAGSFGLNLIVQRTRVRYFVQRWGVAGVALYYVVILSTAVTGLSLIVRGVLRAAGSATFLASPLLFFSFGFLAGIPFTIPTITALWREPRRAEQRAARKKPATRKQRVEFVRNLENQLREYVEASRVVHLELRGDKGEVLSLGTGFTRLEGERLVAALRGELEDVGIRRVEGTSSDGQWWVPVDRGKPKH